MTYRMLFCHGCGSGNGAVGSWAERELSALALALQKPFSEALFVFREAAYYYLLTEVVRGQSAVCSLHSASTELLAA